MPRQITYDELKTLAGQEIGVSDWTLIDQARIDKFAEATGDRQWIHTDAERAAKEMPGGKTIAHGYLTVSLIPMIIGQIMQIPNVRRIINYGSDKVRFLNAVRVGGRVRGRQRILRVEPRGGGLLVINEITIEIEGETKPACIAETISIVYG